MITVIVPVFNQLHITDQFLRCISENVVLPERILLFDNASTERIGRLVKKYGKYGKLNMIKYIRNSKNVGVNAVWNEGIKMTQTPLVSILNNDLILNKYFFKKIIEAFQVNEKYGIFCASNVRSIKQVKQSKDEKVKLALIGKREGWAFTIRRDVVTRLPPIPSDLKIYCGDDYLYYGTREVLGYKAVRITNNYIYHLGGRTVRAKQFRGIRKKEKALWNSSHKRQLFLLKGKI